MVDALVNSPLVLALTADSRRVRDQRIEWIQILIHDCLTVQVNYMSTLILRLCASLISGE